jgi:hypothetical protein
MELSKRDQSFELLMQGFAAREAVEAMKSFLTIPG